MSKDFFKINKGLTLNPQSVEPSVNIQDGDLYYDSSLNALRARINSSWKSLGSGSGEGGVNWILNSNFEADTLGWNTYADTAGTTPVDGTGGSPQAGLFVRNTVNPLRGEADGLIAKGAVNRQGQGVSYDFTVDRAYAESRKNSFTFLVDTTDANYVSGDLACYIYNVDTSTLVTPSATSIPAGYRGPISVAWDSQGTSDSYRAIFHIASTNANAWNVYLDDVAVGPGVVVQGAAVGPWINFTPTSTWISNTTHRGRYRQIGSDMEVYYDLLLTGAPTSTNLDINLPSGFNIDTTKYTNGFIGTYPIAYDINGAIWDNDVTFLFGHLSGHILTASTTSFRVTTSSVTTDGRLSIVTATTPQTFANGDRITIHAKFPIAEWQGASTLYVGQNDVEYAYNTSTSTTTSDTSSFAYGQDGAPIQVITVGLNRRVQFQTPIQAGDEITIELSNDRLKWFPMSGGVNFPGTLFVQTLTSQNTTNYGMGYRVIAGTSQLDIEFAPYSRPSGSTYGANGASWANGGSVYWRVKKTKAGAAVGFGAATTKSKGLNYGFQYLVGQSAAAIANSTTTDIGNGTLTLTPGAYLLEYGGSFQVTDGGTAPTSAVQIIRISDTANNNIAGVGVGLGGVYTSSDRRITAHGVQEYTTTTTISLKLRGDMNVTGGSSITRNIGSAYLKATRVSGSGVS